MKSFLFHFFIKFFYHFWFDFLCLLDFWLFLLFFFIIIRFSDPFVLSCINLFYNIQCFIFLFLFDRLDRLRSRFQKIYELPFLLALEWVSLQQFHPFIVYKNVLVFFFIARFIKALIVCMHY